MRLTVLFLAICSLFTGCALPQLKKNLNRQATSIADIHEQQVLDNLALFSTNRGATPSFALPSGGGTTVNNTKSGNGGLNWNATTLTSSSLGGSASNTLSQNFTLQPINDPDRLELMKCVYLYATCKSSDECLDCASKLHRFFGNRFELGCIPQCFFTTQETKPKRHDCLYKTGSYCGCHVIVEPCNYNDLSRLTMAILDIATVSDEDWTKRTAAKAEEKIELTESFIADLDGKLRLIQAEYSLSKEKFLELQKTGVLNPGSAMDLIGGEQAALSLVDDVATDDPEDVKAAKEKSKKALEELKSRYPGMSLDSFQQGISAGTPAESDGKSRRRQISPGYESLLQQGQAGFLIP